VAGGLAARSAANARIGILDRLKRNSATILPRAGAIVKPKAAITGENVTTDGLCRLSRNLDFSTLWSEGEVLKQGERIAYELGGNFGLANRLPRVKMSLNADANQRIRARASRESLIGEFSGSRCDRITLDAAVWSEDVRRPARRGNESPDSCWPTRQRLHERVADRCRLLSQHC
jgi:hypothetical protein